jgi:hypothetical protein
VIASEIVLSVSITPSGLKTQIRLKLQPEKYARNQDIIVLKKPIFLQRQGFEKFRECSYCGIEVISREERIKFRAEFQNSLVRNSL